jgi:hypothetical protein
MQGYYPARDGVMLIGCFAILVMFGVLEGRAE